MSELTLRDVTDLDRAIWQLLVIFDATDRLSSEAIRLICIQTSEDGDRTMALVSAIGNLRSAHIKFADSPVAIGRVRSK